MSVISWETFGYSWNDSQPTNNVHETCSSSTRKYIDSPSQYWRRYRELLTSERSAPTPSSVVDTQGGAALAADQATGWLQIVPPSAQSGGRPCAILPDWYADCSRRCPIAVYSSSCVQRRLCRPQDPSEIQWEGVLCRCSSSVEPATNRTEVDAFHASFQALLENILL